MNNLITHGVIVVLALLTTLGCSLNSYILAKEWPCKKALGVVFLAEIVFIEAGFYILDNFQFY